MKIRFIFLLLFSSFTAHPQWFGGKKEGSTPINLLLDRAVQINTTSAVNNMYNFNFDEAEREFKWLKVKYPLHPLGDFMLGLNEWWKIIPDTKQTKYDEQCHYYMDQTIDLAEDVYDDNKKNKEAAFFISCAYAIKGRLYAEREKWVKAAWASKQSMKYLENSRGEENINPELLFGDGVYNYYSKWIHENYKSLRPLLTFFRKGEKNLGIKQLENVAVNAFYSRMEARYFLVQIYAMENQPVKSLQMSRQMHELYPNNSFFHRYVARNAFALGRLEEAEVYANELLERLKKGNYGYGSNDGRYAAYILAYTHQYQKYDITKAKYYYQECINYALSNDSKESGYYVASNLALAKFAKNDKEYGASVSFYSEAIKNAEKKSSQYKEAKEGLEEITKTVKKQKK